MGQKREVHVYRLAMRESVDERVLTVGVDRRAIASTYSTSLVQRSKVQCCAMSSKESSYAYSDASLRHFYTTLHYSTAACSCYYTQVTACLHHHHSITFRIMT